MVVFQTAWLVRGLTTALLGRLEGRFPWSSKEGRITPRKNKHFLLAGPHPDHARSGPLEPADG